MTRHEAVVLSYLEWVRLIGVGAIRLDEKRIVRWRPEGADPAQVVADLMLDAPDLGTSATSFILAMLEPEVLDRIREGGIYLGKRLNLDAVRSFHSFGDAALAVHRHDAKLAGVAIDLTPLADGWAPWVAAVEAADRRARGEALLAIFGIPRCDNFFGVLERLTDLERCIALDDIVRARDSMFFGWACVLNAQKVSTGVAPVLPVDVKGEAEALRRDFNVDQPFLARAPRLCDFVASLAAEGERPTDLLVMASLKQHERYVIKREGAALDIPSLVDDIRFLEALNVGAAGLLIQALGERLPGELIQALKVRGVIRLVASDGVATLASDTSVRTPDKVDQIEVSPKINQSLSPQPIEAIKSVEGRTVPAIINEQTAHDPVVTAPLLNDDVPSISCGEATTETRQEAEAALDFPAPSGPSSTPSRLDQKLEPLPTNPESENPSDTEASLGSEVRKPEEVSAGPKSKPGATKSKSKRPRKQKDQPSLLDIP